MDVGYIARVCESGEVDIYHAIVECERYEQERHIY